MKGHVSNHGKSFLSSFFFLCRIQTRVRMCNFHRLIVRFSFNIKTINERKTKMKKKKNFKSYYSWGWTQTMPTYRHKHRQKNFTLCWVVSKLELQFFSSLFFISSTIDTIECSKDVLAAAAAQCSHEWMCFRLEWNEIFLCFKCVWRCIRHVYANCSFNHYLIKKI